MSLCLDWFYKDYCDFRTKPYRKQMYIQLQLNLSFQTIVGIIMERVLIMKFIVRSNLIEMLFLHIELKKKLKSQKQNLNLLHLSNISWSQAVRSNENNSCKQLGLLQAT